MGLTAANTLIRLLENLVRRGFVGLINDRETATAYWRRIAAAGLHQPPESSGKDSRELPSRDLASLMSQAVETPISLLDYRLVYGGMPIQELAVLCKIVRRREPAAIFEIGTFLGETTVQMAVNSDAHIYTLDLPAAEHERRSFLKTRDPALDVYPQRSESRVDQFAHKERITQLLGDSQTFDFTPYEGRIDLVFVDACHDYEHVVSDSKNAFNLLSEDGIVIWHDYAVYAPGVVKALNEISETHSLVHVRGTSLVIHSKQAREMDSA